MSDFKFTIEGSSSSISVANRFQIIQDVIGFGRLGFTIFGFGISVDCRIVSDHATTESDLTWTVKLCHFSPSLILEK